MEGCAEFIFAEKLPHHCHSKSLLSYLCMHYTGMSKYNCFRCIKFSFYKMGLWTKYFSMMMFKCSYLTEIYS